MGDTKSGTYRCAMGWRRTLVSVVSVLCVFMLLFVLRRSSKENLIGLAKYLPHRLLRKPSFPLTQAQRSLFNVTVVTAFLDIGQFGKGRKDNKRDGKIYRKWSTAYSRLLTPVVMYTDSDSFAQLFLDVRRSLLNLTRVVKLNRTQLWSFKLKDRIAAIYSAGYPKHWPNTVYPDYTCVTHAKFDFLMDALDMGYFPNYHIAWMDIGYLRDIAGKNSSTYYKVLPPHGFNSTRVLCGEVYKPNFKLSWKKILRQNINWVAGGFFLATPDVMRSFVLQYRRIVTSLLQLNESQVEQQMLYAMYTDEGRSLWQPTVELQAKHGNWFHIGMQCLTPTNSTRN